jgi:hypothetical protein
LEPLVVFAQYHHLRSEVAILTPPTAHVLARFVQLLSERANEHLLLLHLLLCFPTAAWCSTP